MHTASKKTLDDLICEIRVGAKRGSENLFATAMLVRELRDRIEAGEAGPGVKWTQWACETFNKGATWLNELNAIANARDPAAAAARYHQNNCERQKRLNERRPPIASEWFEVIKMIRSMDAKHIPAVRDYLRELTGECASPDQSDQTRASSPP